MKIVLISGNPKKAEQIKRYAKIDVDHRSIDVDEIQSLDPHEVIEHKVKQAYELVKSPVIVEDTSLIFNALGKLPGTYIKFFIESVGVEGLCKMINDFDDRSAVCINAYALYDGKTLNYFEEYTEGQIADEPIGNGGMAFDAIFIPKGYSQTRAQMNQKDFDESNGRRKALEKLHDFIEAQP